MHVRLSDFFLSKTICNRGAKVKKYITSIKHGSDLVSETNSHQYIKFVVYYMTKCEKGKRYSFL